MLRDLKPGCPKLQMHPSACYGCEDNPVKDEPDYDTDAYLAYSSMIDKVSKMVDAAAFGWVNGHDVSPLEFLLMRTYFRMTQSRRML